jgi:hypothetical protein
VRDLLDLEYFGASPGAAVILGLRPRDAMHAEDLLAGTPASQHIGIYLVADPALHVSQFFLIRDVVLGLGKLNHITIYSNICQVLRQTTHIYIKSEDCRSLSLGAEGRRIGEIEQIDFFIFASLDQREVLR